MSSLFNKVKQFVFDSFHKAGDLGSDIHFTRTAHWVKQLKPDADDALLIAAVAHDIERAHRQSDVLDKKRAANSYSDLSWLRLHEERGADIIHGYLLDNGATAELAERVKMLISRHEEGGNPDQDTLKDADSLSFFENNIPLFLKVNKMRGGNKTLVRGKFDWMFNRISSKKAKQIARPWYEETIKKLDSFQLSSDI